MQQKPLYDRVALIGLGLIGSSLARAIRRKALAGHVAGHARSQQTRDQSMKLGFLDSVHASPEEAAEGADLIVLCTPLGAYDAVLERIAPVLAPGATVSDVGSCKASVAESFARHLPAGVHGIPGHPVAGTENSGPEAGFATLFEQRYCIVTPAPDTDPAALKRLIALWEGVGAMVEPMDAQHHDRVLAITSHLPHLIAYTIVGTASDLESQLKRERASENALVETREVIKYSAGGFRDFTRIAGSDPVMWRDVFTMNRDAVLEMLGRFQEDLVALQRAIRWGEGDKLEDWFTRTREVRRGVVEQGQAGRFYATEKDGED
ncbi:prephenate/arogenate dehydrogenase family protein [Marivibrio halodurans]|uniref:prephenate dehydrogenase n=1 Tax=Marivibrio halodurans TaxID=2039722 RepID=A0A8J7V1U8_9PROT|nr:prephenate/arogenate dehydrogenase family protein [Marivibrio halodurans]MBP5856481.1 prephenate/arogenate dehydrogenase family protein [Marivibrio halodurans]